MRLGIGYPDTDTEYTIIWEDPSRKLTSNIEPVCTRKDILKARDEAYKAYCDDRLLQAAVDIASSTFKYHGVELGVSPRGRIMLITACKAYAFLKGRDYVINQDIVDLAPPVLAHRLKLRDLQIDAVKLIREDTLARIKEIDY